MDPRGTPTLSANPTGSLEALADVTGASFPHVVEARKLTGKRVGETREQLAAIPSDANTSVLVFGSWARGELTSGSDDDWALLYRKPLMSPDDPEVDSAYQAAQAILGGKGREPGSQDGDDSKWVERNAKLRTSRKLLFAAGLLPVLLCHLKDRDEMQPFLQGWFAAPATDRLAAAFLHVDAAEAGARTIAAYDRWMAIMLDDEARAKLRDLRHDTRSASPLWHEIRSIGNEFDRGLVSLLFDTRLAPLAQKYGLF